MGCVGSIKQESNNPHPAPFPLELAKKCITAVGDPVLDLFMGSGTKAIASERAVLKWVRSEKSKVYVDMANKRIEALRATGALKSLTRSSDVHRHEVTSRDWHSAVGGVHSGNASPSCDAARWTEADIGPHAFWWSTGGGAPALPSSTCAEGRAPIERRAAAPLQRLPSAAEARRTLSAPAMGYTVDLARSFTAMAE